MNEELSFMVIQFVPTYTRDKSVAFILFKHAN